MKKITLLFTLLLVCALGQSQVSGVFADDANYLQWQEEDDNSTGATIRISPNWTMEFWLKADAGERGFVVMNGTTSSTTGSFKIAPRGDVAPGLFRVIWDAGNGDDVIYIEPDTSPMDGSWHHLAIVGKNNSGTVVDVTVYVDGVAATNVAAGGVNSYDRNVITFTNGATANDGGDLQNFTVGSKTGGSSTNHYFAGELDELKTWTRALSGAELLAVATSCTQPSSTGLHRYMAFENNTDETAGGKTVADIGTGINGYSTGVCTALSAKNNVLNAALKIYPNPARNVVSIEKQASVNLKSVALYSILGNEVYKSTNTTSINVSNFAKGLYLLKIESNEGAVATKKIIVD